MGAFSMWHWLIVLAIVLIIFGAGKLPKVMGDFGKGIKNFKEGMKDQEAEEAARKLEEQNAAKPAQPAAAANLSASEAARSESAPRA
ncbi:MAG: hypothetical protein OHK0024_32430 [Thalassobaculales bacterium]